MFQISYKGETIFLTKMVLLVFHARYTANLVVHLTTYYVYEKYQQIADLHRNNVSLYIKDSRFARYFLGADADNTLHNK